MEKWSNTNRLLHYSNPPILQHSNPPLPRFFRRHSGFTLLEVMIAVSIIAIVLVAIFGSQSQSLSLANDAKFNTTAALLAQRKMAEVETANSLDVSATSGDFDENFSGYRWELNVSEIPLSGAEGLEYLKQVDVIVYGGDQDKLRYALRLYRFMPKAK